jgi:hypothetical protein
MTGLSARWLPFLLSAMIVFVAHRRYLRLAVAAVTGA